MTITCKPLCHMPIGKEWPNPLLNPWYYQERDFTPLLRTLQALPQSLLDFSTWGFIRLLKSNMSKGKYCSPLKFCSSLRPYHPPICLSSQVLLTLHSPSPVCQTLICTSPGHFSLSTALLGLYHHKSSPRLQYVLCPDSSFYFSPPQSILHYAASRKLNNVNQTRPFLHSKPPNDLSST